MKSFFISDHHFGHKNILQYASRPFSDVEEMHTALISRWNSVVTPEDRVYYIGDFAFLPLEHAKNVLSQLNGHKILIQGNHDPNRGKCLEMGFNEVYSQLTVSIQETSVLLCHYPYRPQGELTKRFKRYPMDKGHWLIHGHVHNLWKQRGKMINVSVEMWDYTPVSEAQLLELISAGPRDVDVNTEKLLSATKRDL